MEEGFFEKIASIDAKALELYDKDHALAKKFLTQYTIESMEKIVKMYKDLRLKLITKYTNNKLGL